MMKYFYALNTCSIGIRVLLEEIGAPYAAHQIDFAAKQQFSPEFRVINPKGKVPALVREDGSLVTEFQTIAFWLADSHPQAGLLPRDPEGRMRVMEILDFIVAAVHMRGFTFVLVPHKFTQNPEFQAELVAHGKDQVQIGFDRLSDVLGDKDWLMGAFSIADAGLFYLTQWASVKGIDMPPSIRAFHNRMLDRPSVGRALAGEGLEIRRA